MHTDPITPHGRQRYNERVIIEVARQFYLDGLSQKQIAEYWRREQGYTMSQSTVSRLVERAKAKGFVRIHIHLSHALDLEQRLAEKLRPYGIREVFVALTESKGNAIENLGTCGAEVLLHTLRKITRPTIRLAMSCGRTLSAVVNNFFNHIEHEEQDSFWQKAWELYPTYLVDDERFTIIHPHALVATFAVMLTRHVHSHGRNGDIKAVLPSLPPGFYDLENEAQEDWLAHSHIRERMEQGQTADIFLFGIGHLDKMRRQMLKQLDPRIKNTEYIAESNYIPIRADGCQNETIERKIVGLGIERFRSMIRQPEKYIIAVAGSKDKVELVRASLMRPYYNILVTCENVAADLLTQL